MCVLYGQVCHAVDRSVHIRRGSRNAMKGSSSHMSYSVWHLAFVGQPARSGLGRFLPTLQLLPKLSTMYRQYVNLVCIRCQCFGNWQRTSLLSVQVPREELAESVGSCHQLGAYMSGWGGAEHCRRSWRALAVRHVGPVLLHRVIRMGVELHVGGVVGGLLLQWAGIGQMLTSSELLKPI